MNIAQTIMTTIKSAVDNVLSFFDSGEKVEAEKVENEVKHIYKTAQEEAAKEDRELTQEEEAELSKTFGTLLEEKVIERAEKLKDTLPEGTIIPITEMDLNEAIIDSRPSPEEEAPQIPKERIYKLNRKARRFMKIMNWKEDMTHNGLVPPEQDVHPRVYQFVNTLMNDNTLTKEKKRAKFAKFFALNRV